jgi:hypothetical protein
MSSTNSYLCRNVGLESRTFTGEWISNFMNTWQRVGCVGNILLLSANTKSGFCYRAVGLKTLSSSTKLGFHYSGWSMKFLKCTLIDVWGVQGVT